MAIDQMQPDTEHVKNRLSDSEKQWFDAINTETRNHERNVQTSDSETFDDDNNPNHIPSDLLAEFQEAIKENNQNMMNFYIEEHSKLDLFHHQFKNNLTALMLAAMHKSHEVIQEILENGISSQNLNSQHHVSGDTAFHIAARHNDLKTVRLLLHYDADTDIKNKDGETPLSIARERKYTEIMREIKKCTNHFVTVDTSATLPNLPSNNLSLQNLQHHSARRTTQIRNFAHSILFESPHIALAEMDENDCSNPGSPGIPLNQMNTRAILDLTDEAFSEIKRDNNHTLRECKPINDWLDKKKKGLIGSFKKRWVLCMHGHLLWCDRQISVQGPLDQKERRRWENCINLTRIIKVEAIPTKKEKKFKIVVLGIKRPYIFRAKNKQKRDEWIDGINEHMAGIKMCAMLRGVSDPKVKN